MGMPAGIFSTTMLGIFQFNSDADAPISILNSGTLWSRGDDVQMGTGNFVLAWNNKYPTPVSLSQPPNGFEPILVTTPFSGVNFGAGANLNDFQNLTTKTDDLIGTNTWHVFAIVSFDDITANDGPGYGNGYNHLIIGQWGNANQTCWALTAKNNNGHRVAQGYFSSSIGTYLVTSSMPINEVVVVEWYSDGSTMGIRVNDNPYFTSPIQGENAMLGFGNDFVRVGSKNFEGGWDVESNKLFEICTSPRKQNIIAVRNARSYFKARYNLLIQP